MAMHATPETVSLPIGLTWLPDSDMAALSDNYANTHLRLTRQIRHIVAFDGNA